MRLQSQFAVVMHRGSGSRITALPKAELGRLMGSGIIGSPRFKNSGRKRTLDATGNLIYALGEFMNILQFQSFV